MAGMFHDEDEAAALEAALGLDNPTDLSEWLEVLSVADADLPSSSDILQQQLLLQHAIGQSRLSSVHASGTGHLTSEAPVATSSVADSYVANTVSQQFSVPASLSPLLQSPAQSPAQPSQPLLPQSTNLSPVTMASQSAAAGDEREELGKWRYECGALTLSLGVYEEVLNNNFDYWEVNKQLKEAGMTMIKLLKVHNSPLLERFDTEADQLCKGRPPGFERNIQKLYHGTATQIEMICEEGLDERLGVSGHFGRGIYFCDNPARCRVFSEANVAPNQRPFVLRCRVLLGESKVYPPGQTDVALTREPVKHMVDGKNVFYDSVKGKPGNFTEYVVYEKRRVFVEYVVFYSCSQPLPVLPPLPAAERRAVKSASNPVLSSAPAAAAVSAAAMSSSSSFSGTNDAAGGAARRLSVTSGSGTDSDNRSTGSGASQSSDSDNDSRSGSPLLPPDRNDFVFQRVPPAGADDGVQRVTTVRSRTRALMASGQIPTSTGMAIVSSATPGLAHTSMRATIQPSVPTSYVPAQTSAEAQATARYRAQVQQDALKKMLEIKDMLTEKQREELMASFAHTYGGVPPPDDITPSGGAMAAAKPAVPAPVARPQRARDADDCVSIVMNNLVSDFQSVTNVSDTQVARRYIERCNMDVQAAILAYFDENT